MSKISLSGNASGTGVLTIAAPDTNSDRTLTLPDAAGTMFNQGNIVGTVSESSGVPTGAIIEQGSNANGEFVKYADGTMIVWGSVSITPVANTPTSATFTYPATFSATPFAQATAYAESSVLTRPAMISATPTTTSCQVNVIRTNTTSTQNAVAVFGRWF